MLPSTKSLRALFFFVFVLTRGYAADFSITDMLSALEKAAEIDRMLCERFPVTYNNLFSTGYFITPSARMTDEGTFGAQIASVPPYLHYNARVQPFYFLELSANYRVFRHFEDPVIGASGFGDYADRGANFKVAIATPEDSLYMLPGVAFGFEDFMGSRKFHNFFIVATQVWQDFNLETTIGWGKGRFSGCSRGFFGGFNWWPIRWMENRWMQGICFSAEYDPINYKKDPHPDGRKKKFPINFGVKYQFGKIFELSLAFIRGDQLAIAGTISQNLGQIAGFLPKLSDPPPYTAPLDHEPLGSYRPENVMIQSLNYAFMCQGLSLMKAWIQEDDCKSRLILSLINCRYRQEHVLRMRLQYLLASLIPANIDEVVVIVESCALPCQQYVYPREVLCRFFHHAICQYEVDILTPRCEVLFPDRPPLFDKSYPLFKVNIGPRLESFFGSASGKVKYDLGVKAGLDGFLPFNIYYDFQVSYIALSNIKKIASFDFFNPSQLPNVATDYIRYRQENAFTWDRIYLQKSGNLGYGLFARAAAGYFQVNYAGVAGELLWYPAQSLLAIGLEGAVLRKRNYSGLGFQSKLRQFKGREPIFRSYTTLQQYFLTLYLDIPEICLFTKVSVGQFLARDKGVRVEATRYFHNGIRFTGWFTYTNAHDKVHGQDYYDRGVAIEIPFDFFYKCSSRRVWNYGLAAWLRDAGYAICPGKGLFETINRERRF